MKTFAMVEENPGPAETTLDLTVYQDGRIIQVAPSQQYGWYAPGEEDAAIARIRECYPDAQILSPEEFKRQWQADGYRWPGEWDKETLFTCDCGGSHLFIKHGYERAGMNAPHGALIHIRYRCRACEREYCVMRQEVQDGWLEDWSTQEFDGGPSTECARPRLDCHNPHGFVEFLLAK